MQIHKQVCSGQSSGCCSSGCLWVTPGAVVGIVTKFATHEAAIGLNWGSCIVILGHCVHDASLTILMLPTRPLTGLGVVSLLVLVLIVPMTLLSRALCLIVVVPTLVFGAELRTLGVVLSGVSVGLPLVLPLMVGQFFPFVFKANCLVQQSLEVGETVAL